LMREPYFTDGHTDDIDIREANDFKTDSVERSQKIYQGNTTSFRSSQKEKD